MNCCVCVRVWLSLCVPVGLCLLCVCHTHMCLCVSGDTHFSRLAFLCGLTDAWQRLPGPLLMGDLQGILLCEVSLGVSVR